MINAYKLLKIHKSKLTFQQYRTIKGQIRAGDVEGAIRGLKRVLQRKEG